MDAVVGESQITYDARGLVEVDDTVLGVAVVKDGKATIDASELTTRKINLEIRSLVYEQGIEDVTILNPEDHIDRGVVIKQLGLHLRLMAAATCMKVANRQRGHPHPRRAIPCSTKFRKD